MSFLNPLMLIGVSAIAVPIIIHFLNRRKFKTIIWAAMKFVKLSVDQNQRRMRLEDLILLLIRCALLALLALALARPALKSSRTDVLGQAKVTGVVVLDNSYSMDLRAGAGSKSAFEQARAAAKATLDAMPSGSAVGVLLASDVVLDVIDEPTYDLNQAHDEIDRAKVSHHATDLFPAVGRAVEILKGRAALRKEIYVITDGQASGWQQNADIQRLIENNKDAIDVYVLRVGKQEPPRNLAITKMDISSGLTPANHPLRFEIEVANHDDEEATDVAVSLYVDGEKDPRDRVNIPAVPPGGTTSVPLYTRLEEVGYHSIRAAFPDPAQYDDLPADNQNLLVVRAMKEVRVLIVDGDREARDIRDHESFFLQAALSPVEDHYVKVDVKSPEEYAQGGLKRYTAVVMANVPRLTPDNVEGLKTYIRNGGGLIFYPGEEVDLDFYNHELFEKHGLLPSPWGDAAGDATQDEVFVEFQKRAYEHPVTALWNNPEFGELGVARTFRRMPLNEDAEQPEVKEAGPAKVVLRYEKKPKADEEKGTPGTPAIMEREWGEGRVYQFSSTADTAWGDLPVRGSSVVPLLYRIIGSVQAHQDAGLNLRVGEPFLQPLAAHQNNSEGTVLMPALAQTNALTAEVLNDRPVLQFKDTHRAGLYEFQLKGDSQQMLFAVQPDQRESDLRKIVNDDLPVPPDQVILLDDSTDFTDFKTKVQDARRGAEYWLLILLVVLVLAGLETYLAQKFSQSK
jgi:hypothetical protein